MKRIAHSAREAQFEFPSCLKYARAGNRDAMGRLLGHALPYLESIARSYGRGEIHRDDRDRDIVQDALLRAQRYLHTFQGASYKEFLAWLRRILLHLLSNERVERAHEPQHLPLTEGPADLKTPSWVAMLAERDQAVRKEIEQLDAETRLIMDLRHLRQWNWPEIGRHLGRSPDSVRMTHMRALRRLSLVLQNVKPDP